ncbi:Flp pilus assembly complex ATPase component TadA [Microcoleus sp. ZQ-A2]|nr:Flp pilus assembly complex ATPase component TadA [Microcoleus sp. FACHB-1]
MTNSSSQRRALIVRNEVSPFGKSLIAAGYVDTDQMQNALVESRKSGRPLTEILESMTGRQLSPDLLRQYKKQQLFELKVLYGVESLDPEINEIATHQVGQLIDTLLPIDICRRYRLVPLSKNETQPPSLLVAMVDPDNLDAQDDLNRILRPQGITLQRMVITQEDYQQIISKYLDEKLAKQKQMEVEQAVDVKQDLQNIDSLDTLSDAPDEEAELDVGGAEDAPVINLVNKVLAKALQEGVSDIHVEPQENALRIRFRKDGVLRQAFEPLPKKITPAVSARFKIMAELDIAERRLPQDGKIRRMYQGRKVDFRVSTLPSRYGEKVVLRILDNEQTQLGLDKLITDQDTLQTVREMANRPFGLILVTGPTGSGKSTTLYSMLAERNDPGVNISTAEDPIEYSLAGITQVQVLREKGMDFASILRSFLRQDPDVILVGETRDKETAKTAIEAALTGHLVLTTLHTNDAAGAIPRLDEMGVEPFMVSNALLGVLAQRLIRRVCSECRITYVPTSAELGRFGLSTSRDGEIMLYQANTLQPDEIQEARAKGKLCQLCNGVGYKGRVGVYEVMRISDRLQTLINEAAPAERLKEAAVEEGMTTLLAYSLNLVQQGYTTLDEVERVTFTDSGLEAERKAKRKSSLSCRTCSATLQQEWLDCPYCMTPRFQD